MLEDSPGITLFLFALPMILGNLFQQFYNMVDSMIVGQFVGEKALAAVGASYALTNVFVMIAIGGGIGASVITSQYLGAGDTGKMKTSVYTALLTFLAVGGLLGVFGFLMNRQILVWLNTPDDILVAAGIYLGIYFLGMPFFMLYNYGAAILRAVGDTKRPLFFLVISGMTNAVLNLVLVIVFHMGVAGVAIGTIVSQLISSILVLRCLYTSNTSYRLYFSKLGIKTQYLKQIFQVGIPAGIQSTVINLSNALLQSSVNSFGSVAMAGYTAANNIFGFLYMSVNAVTQSCMSFTSQNYGVKKLKRMDRVLLDCMILSVGVTLTLGCGAYFFGPELLKIYTSDADVIRCGVEVLAFTTVPYFCCGIMDLLPGALRGMGYSGVPMILSIIGTVGTRIVWIFGLFPAHRSLSFLFISYPVSWILTILMQAVCFCFVRKHVHQSVNRDLA